MIIALNGNKKELDAPLTVAALLKELNLDASRVAVELNRDILPRERFGETTLADGDRLEVVQFVGGG